MVNQITIRAAADSDLSAIEDCVAAAYTIYVERLGKQPGPMCDDYRKVLENHYVVVAEDVRGEILGLLVLILSRHSILMDNVAVHPSQQGRGVGRLLIEHAEHYAKSRGYNCLSLYTHVKMTENIALYTRIGYRVTERKIVNGYSRVYMEKGL